VAQVYNHIIMPLASPHDQRTQVLWGIAISQTLRPEPEGMWLAETAVDIPSLEALAAPASSQGSGPRQAKRWRKFGDERWTEIQTHRPSRAYLCKLPSGKTISLFFYDALSRGRSLSRPARQRREFLGRLMQGFDDRRQHAQLMHIATDGESYGHHHPHGDMALAMCSASSANATMCASRTTANPGVASARVEVEDRRQDIVSCVMAWNAGAPIAAATRDAAGNSSGVALCAKPSTCSRTSSTCSLNGAARNSFSIRGKARDAYIGVTWTAAKSRCAAFSAARPA